MSRHANGTNAKSVTNGIERIILASKRIRTVFVLIVTIFRITWIPQIHTSHLDAGGSNAILVIDVIGKIIHVPKSQHHMGFVYIVKICKNSLTFPNATTLQNVHGLNVMHVINVTAKIILVLHLVMIFVFIAKIYATI